MGDNQLDIVVNGKQETASPKELTFDQVVQLACPDAVSNDDGAVQDSEPRADRFPVPWG